MNSTVYIVTTLLAFVLGQWLVTRKHWSGFLVWCAANIYSIVTCVLTDMPKTSFLFVAYFLVNFASLRSWWAKSRVGSRPHSPKASEVAIRNLLAVRAGALGLSAGPVRTGTDRPLP